MHYSILNQEKYNAIKKDVQGSIIEHLDKLFDKSHLVDVRSEGSRTYLIFEWVDENGQLQKDSTWFDSRMFFVSE